MILGGLLLLLLGGELLVRGAARIAESTGVSPALIGLTVVAAGTSMPEAAVSIDAALRGVGDMAVGNVVGSNIYNILLILGAAALVRPCRLQGRTVRMDWPVMVAAALGLWVCALDGTIARWEGGVLLATLVGFVGWTVHRSSQTSEAVVEQLEAAASPRPSSVSWAAVTVMLGIGLLVGGGRLFLDGAVSVAEQAGLSPRVIGLTLVAVGTSLPELATSVIASWRGHDDVAVGNVVGSNIFNALGIAGASAVITPLPVSSEALGWDLPCMALASVALFLAIWPGWRIPRYKAVILLLSAVAYTWSLL